ncbi:hypothetical protein [Thalassotalea ganghwensis]
MKKYLALLVLLMSGCVGMKTYKGVVVQFSDVTKNSDGSYSVEVLGHTDLNETDMVDLVKLKGKELCKSNDVLVKSYDMGTYGSHTQFGSVYPPKINATVNCKVN